MGAEQDSALRVEAQLQYREEACRWPRANGGGIAAGVEADGCDFSPGSGEQRKGSNVLAQRGTTVRPGMPFGKAGEGWRTYVVKANDAGLAHHHQGELNSG